MFNERQLRRLARQVPAGLEAAHDAAVTHGSVATEHIAVHLATRLTAGNATVGPALPGSWVRPRATG